MIAIVLQVMWTIMAVLLTKNYYDNSSYRMGCYQCGFFWRDGFTDDSRGSHNLLRGGA